MIHSRLLYCNRSIRFFTITSVTLNSTMYVPSTAYWWKTVAPYSIVPSPIFQWYSRILPSRSLLSSAENCVVSCNFRSLSPVNDADGPMFSSLFLSVTTSHLINGEHKYYQVFFIHNQTIILYVCHKATHLFFIWFLTLIGTIYKKVLAHFILLVKYKVWKKIYYY